MEVDKRVSLPPMVVVALGGNAMQSPRGDDSVESDFERTRATAERLVEVLSEGRARLVITHGNGPQVGNHLFRSELAHERGGLPLLPLDVCVADTQGGMGYVLQQCLTNALHERSLAGVVATVVTQVVVDRHDPAFATPTKPVGEVISDDAVEKVRAWGWDLRREEVGGGWRRVVASPDPREIVEGEAIARLVDAGVVVIAAGGGGIPVVETGDGLRGVAAVVDKDLASALLAADLNAETLVIATDVPGIALGYGTEEESFPTELKLDEARKRSAEGEFPAGSMGPKVEALCRFADATGRLGVVCAVDAIPEALRGQAGTRIAP